MVTCPEIVCKWARTLIQPFECCSTVLKFRLWVLESHPWCFSMPRSNIHTRWPFWSLWSSDVNEDTFPSNPDIKSFEALGSKEAYICSRASRYFNVVCEIQQAESSDASKKMHVGVRLHPWPSLSRALEAICFPRAARFRTLAGNVLKDLCLGSFANAKTGALCLYLLTILAKPFCKLDTLSFVKGLTFNTIIQRQPAVKRISAMSFKPSRGVPRRLQRSSISFLLKASDCGRLSRCTSGTWKAAMFPSSSSLLALVTRTHRDVTETTCWQHYQFPHDFREQ